MNRWWDVLRVALAVLAVAAAWVGWGLRGAALAVTVLAFLMLLEFNRGVRVLRAAAARPLGTVDSAVMLHARLQPGMRLPAVLALTRSLGRKVADDPETWAWADAGGDTVRVELRAGRVARWTLDRAQPAPPGLAP